MSRGWGSKYQTIENEIKQNKLKRCITDEIHTCIHGALMPLQSYYLKKNSVSKEV